MDDLQRTLREVEVKGREIQRLLDEAAGFALVPSAVRATKERLQATGIVFNEQASDLRRLLLMQETAGMEEAPHQPSREESIQVEELRRALRQIDSDLPRLLTLPDEAGGLTRARSTEAVSWAKVLFSSLGLVKEAEHNLRRLLLAQAIEQSDAERNAGPNNPETSADNEP